MPLWGDASEDVINEFKLKFKLSQSELEILFGAYREDNPNSACFCFYSLSCCDDLEPLGIACGVCFN